MKSDADKLSDIEKRLELGLISRVEAIMKDRGIGREEAESILAEINEQAN